MIKRCLTSLVATLIVCFLACSSASARVCFLPDSTDCGSSDVNIPDVPCKYYSCKEAGGESNAYQTCYPERTYNNGGVNVTCWQVKCNISKSECEAQAKATSQSCKFDDASGCYYLGECKQCNKDLYDLKEPKSGSDWECDSCTGCDGTFYNCTAKEKECSQINPNYTSSCSDSQTAEEVKGVKDSKGNQCYTCKSKPIDKCVDIEATPFLDIIEPTVTTVKASGEVKEVNATLECGINPKKAYKYEINIINNYDYINLPVKRIKPVEYRYYASGSLPGYYYKTNIDGKNVCITDRLCTQYAKDGEYISAYEISIKDMSVKLDYKIYCCKTDDNFSGDSLSYLYSSCKEAQTVFESQHIDRYIEPFYVCDKGVKEGTKCKIGSYSCPKDYKLSGDNCVKKECPKGYVLTSDNGKDVCVNPTYTCPTDGKYKYKLSGDKCVCENDCTYEYTRVDDSNTQGSSAFNAYLHHLFSNHDRITNATGIYWKGPGDFDENHDYSGYQMYSRIDKNSRSCQKDNKTVYETICPGTARAACKKKFVPNGCSSEQYAVYRLTVEGTDFGDCSCDTSKGLYDTDKSCTDATGLKCTGGKKGSCYQTCESADMYSTEDACKKAASKYTECKFDAGSNCYAPYKMGWGIHYTHKVEKESNRTYNCIRETHGSNSTYTSSVSWSVYVMNGDNYNQAQALNGNKYQRIDDHEGEVRYPAGKYKICFDQSYAGSRGNISIYYMHLAKRSGDWCDYRWNDSDSQWHAAENNKEFCSDAIIFTSSTACIIATFEDNTEYYVEGSFKVREGERDGVYTYTCTQVEYAPY